jgi:hypothetical protein
MSLTIPTLPLPYYSSRVRLDDRDYTLEFWYSTRAERYYMHIYDQEEKPILFGLKLVSNVPLLRFYHHKPGVPAGEILVTCATLDTRPPVLGELGEGLRCELTYFARDELTTALAAQGV